MDYRAVFQVSASGMDVERLRLDIAALNLANMATSAAPGTTGFHPLRVVSQPVAPSFGPWMERQSGGGASARVVPVDVPDRVVHDPADPHADARGDVHYPGVDHAGEMINVLNALRAYEANVAALSAARSMAGHALEIGGRS